jgi:hypothetical protein
MSENDKQLKVFAVRVMIFSLTLGLILFGVISLFLPISNTCDQPGGLRLVQVLSLVAFSLAIISVVLMGIFVDLVIPTMEKYYHGMTDSLWLQQRIVPVVFFGLIAMFGVNIVLLGRLNFQQPPFFVYLNFLYLVLFLLAAQKAWPAREPLKAVQAD